MNEHIEEILMEASAYNMRAEVESTAQQLLLENPNWTKLECYEAAYNDWIK